MRTFLFFILGLFTFATSAFACEEPDFANIYNQQGELVYSHVINPTWHVNEFNTPYLLIQTSEGKFFEIYGNPIIEKIAAPMHRDPETGFLY